MRGLPVIRIDLNAFSAIFKHHGGLYVNSSKSREGDHQKSAELLPLIYDELRKLAQVHLSKERSGHTFQATALVHEAWLRMVGEGDRTWQNRASFFAAASSSMRRILVDYARHRARLKHGGGQIRLDIDDVDLSDSAKDESILLVDEAMERLKQLNAQRAKIVELKFFGGMTNREVGETLGISERTVERHWVCAKIWLLKTIRSRM